MSLDFFTKPSIFLLLNLITRFPINLYFNWRNNSKKEYYSLTGFFPVVIHCENRKINRELLGQFVFLRILTMFIFLFLYIDIFCSLMIFLKETVNIPFNSVKKN